MLTGFDITELLCMYMLEDITEEGKDKVWIIGIEQLRDGTFVYTPIEITDKLVLQANSYIRLAQLKKGKDGPLFQYAFKYEFFDKILYKGILIILAETVVHELYQVQDDSESN